MRRPEELNIRKAARISIAADVLQVLLVCGLAVWLLLNRGAASGLVRWGIFAGAFCVAIGSAADIRNSLSQRRLIDTLDDMTLTMEAQEQLNVTLRSQRHDFLNHLQVVYSLMEMEDYPEAMQYIEKIYGDITSVSRVLKTANPAVNALLQVKAAACDRAGVTLELDITSAWKELPVEGWEMCKVLSNLMDNALDAMKGQENAVLKVQLTEDLLSFRFAVSNNGPAIPEKLKQSIFQAGITTKAEGHGMGLHIVRQTLRAAGGEILLDSTPEWTTFSGWVPKETVLPETAEKKPLPAANVPSLDDP